MQVICDNSQALQPCYQMTRHLVHVFVFENANSDFLALASAHEIPRRIVGLLVQIFSNINAEVVGEGKIRLTQLHDTKCREHFSLLEFLDIGKIALVISTPFKFIQVLHGASAYHLATDKRQSLPPHQEN